MIHPVYLEAISRELKNVLGKIGERPKFVLMILTQKDEETYYQTTHDMSGECLLEVLREQVRLLEQGTAEHEAGHS
jgi:hypothetical protein